MPATTSSASVRQRSSHSEASRSLGMAAMLQKEPKDLPPSSRDTTSQKCVRG